MHKKIIEELIISVSKLQTDVEWVKKYIYICVTASITAAIGALGQVLHMIVSKLFH